MTVRVCGCGMGSGGLACPVWLGSGGAAEGDFEAEVAELADVVGDLPADVALALVVVRAEVFIPGAGAGEQGVVDLQLGVAEGDLGFGGAAWSIRKTAGRPSRTSWDSGAGCRRGGSRQQRCCAAQRGTPQSCPLMPCDHGIGPHVQALMTMPEPHPERHSGWRGSVRVRFVLLHRHPV